MADELENFLEPPQEETIAPEQEVAQETGAEETQAAAEIVVAPVEDLAAKVKGLEAAAAAERHRRQEVERRLAEKEQEEKPYLGEEYEQRFTETEQKFQQQLINQKLDISESFAREKYTDFNEKLAVFEALVQENPALYNQMIQQANPAEFAYKTATNQQKLKEMGDPSEYEAKLREKLEAEYAAKYEARLAEETKKRTALPGTLAGAPGAAGATAQTWAGPTSLNDLLK